MFGLNYLRHPNYQENVRVFPQVYQSCYNRLRAPDIDQEVKERAIACMGQIVANLGDYLKAELPNCLPIFLERSNILVIDNFVLLQY